MGFNSGFKGLKAQHVSSGTPLIIRSSKLFLQPLVYVPIRWPAVAKAEWALQCPLSLSQRPVTVWAYNPEAVNTVWSSWWWAVCRSKHVEPLKNFGIINFITKLHLVVISTECIFKSYRNSSLCLHWIYFVFPFRSHCLLPVTLNGDCKVACFHWSYIYTHYPQ